MSKDKQSLYQITEAQKDLISKIEMQEGELTENDELNLEITKNEVEHKSMAYLSVIRKKEAENTMIEAEIKRLQAIVKRNKATVTNLKSNLLKAVETFGTFEVNFTKFTTRKSQVVFIEFEDELDKTYLIEKLSTTPDKKAIKEVLKNGNKVKGAILQDNYSLSIR